MSNSQNIQNDKKKEDDEALEYENKNNNPLFFEHLGKHRHHWHNVMLGANDGLISAFLHFCS